MRIRRHTRDHVAHDFCSNADRQIGHFPLARNRYIGQKGKSALTSCAAQVDNPKQQKCGSLPSSCVFGKAGFNLAEHMLRDQVLYPAFLSESLLESAAATTMGVEAC